MADSVILNSPPLLMGALLGIFLLLFQKNTRSGGMVLSVISAVVSLAVIFVAILYGAGWEELIVLILVYLLVSISGDRAGGR